MNTYPSPEFVLAGVAYGPNGNDFVGIFASPMIMDTISEVRADQTAELAKIAALPPDIVLAIMNYDGT